MLEEVSTLPDVYAEVSTDIALCKQMSRGRRFDVRLQTFLEVDALLDHLFRHGRRFVTSNPLRITSDLLWLPSYVKLTTVNRLLAVTAISVH